MGEKQKEYCRLAERHSASLKMSGYRKELNHDAILELKVSLDNARENELRPLKAKLESYRGLPPNPGNSTKFWRSWVPLRDSSSKRSTNLCYLSQIVGKARNGWLEVELSFDFEPQIQWGSE